ncbi:N-acetylmuramoyl-L-alanine amidase [Paracoccus spongiarum]|uniref:N-acetylmuramoyl-L-alanine amidase n=1 Tax=Paracoccus spongiarum TaxID=3064387 RepID=A0ABT9J9D7_9RHOB|nr:N-acetylmuramoyl-L-alanine amidase [Paracoccus sp. 2205BS29-5]MDP5305686.1 N-acetylmuramoyl-L-alanine amidase [Paracoccus sp. 2205BS29-5]
MIRVLILWLSLCMAALPAAAEGPARLDLGASALTREGRGWFGPPPLRLRLVLDRAVPYRVFMVADPIRLIVDLKGADLAGQKPGDLYGSDLVPAIRWGRQQRGWSRIVLDLPAPYRIAEAGQRTTAPQPVIDIALRAVDAAAFAPRASAATALRDLPPPADTGAGAAAEAAPEALVVALDPGHGGFDPGAEAGGATEADLVLTFARELREVLAARGIGVAMTRDDDSFVSLEDRMTRARAAGARLLVSLHADALPEGQAAGATVYLWNPAANERAGQQLVLRHDRADLLAGVDLGGQDDLLAGTLIDFARVDTQARSANFARFLTSRMALMGIGLHGRPVQGAAFSVLKSPDIASVLLELGFISDDRDRANLTDPDWRARMVAVLADSISGWARDDGARAAMLRR